MKLISNRIMDGMMMNEWFVFSSTLSSLSVLYFRSQLNVDVSSIFGVIFNENWPFSCTNVGSTFFMSISVLFSDP